MSVCSAKQKRGRARRAPPEGPPMTGAIRLGLLTIAVFFGGIGSWAAMAPLNGAVIASGDVAVHGNSKTVQHQQGGTVSALLVQEGSVVHQGQVLIRLDNTQAQAIFRVHQSQLFADQALMARDMAEMSGASNIVFPTSLSPDDPVAASMMAREQVVFHNHRDLLKRQLDVLDQRIAQSREQAAGARDQLASAERQMKLAQQEQHAVGELAQVGLAPKNRMLELGRSVAGFRGQVGQLNADVARFGSQAVELEAEKLRVRQTTETDATNELRQAQVDVNDVLPRLAADRARLRRLAIRAPISGRVVNLTIFTKGGVVEPGRPLMTIVPLHPILVAEAQVNPQDVEHLHVGQAAEVIATGFSMADAAPITGKIQVISADRITDPRTGHSYFKTEIALVHDAQGGTLLRKLSPGMPIEVVVPTQARTALEYLVGPLRDSFRKAWREM